MRFKPLEKLVLAMGVTTALQELLYGFIMSLIFIYAARFGMLTFNDPIEFVNIIIGMDLTWGAIDGLIFYYLGVCS